MPPAPKPRDLLPPSPSPRAPLWEGPGGLGRNGGVTQGLLGRFLACREKFRVHALLGLRTKESFNHRIEYGQMWHTCEEALAGKRDWVGPLREYVTKLGLRYPLDRNGIDHWGNVCASQFPCYIDYWKTHPDVMKRTPLLEETAFSVNYVLPSRRVIRLRGKWDSVDLVDNGVYLMENKTKGDVDETALKRMLGTGFELQTMFYLTALAHSEEIGSMPSELGGARYNVVRRPLSGGKGSIVQKKPTKGNPWGESSSDFYARLGGIISGSPHEFFYRWKVEINAADVARFRRECLDPLLENLCDWWEAMRLFPDNPFASHLHWREPLGVYRPDEGRSDALDEYLQTGSALGLETAATLFRELEGEG